MKKIKKKKARGPMPAPARRGKGNLQADGNFELGISCHKNGQTDKAILFYKEALKAAPDFDKARYAMGIAFQEKGDLDAAMACYMEALRINPNNAMAYNNLGSILQAMGRLPEAITNYEKAISLNPNFDKALNNLGKVLQEIGRIDEAIICHEEALRLNANNADARYSLGNAYRKRTQFDKAILCYQEALQIAPDFADAYLALGNVMKDRGNFDEAEENFRSALRIKPDYASAFQSLLMTMLYEPRYDAQKILDEHLRFARRFESPLLSAAPRHYNDRTPGRRLRIGYVSPDFRLHSVAFFIEPVLKAHNRENFAISCYSNVSVPDSVTERISGIADNFQSIAGMPDEKVAELVRKDRIDVLVDLAGHTAGNRILVFARKPAPVQASWLGYPATTGLSAIDYKIVDCHTDPPGSSEKFYAEKLMRLPDSFLSYAPPEFSPEVGMLPSVQSGRITFGSLNHYAKISPEIIALWAQILHRVPDARLLLKAYSFKDPAACSRVTDIFTREGISDCRVDFLPWEPSVVKHLEIYNRIDIGLDTYPYNGTTTTCEALWMGVPVVTLAGGSHMSRVGASLLSNVGIISLVAATQEEYVNFAVHLAGDRDNLRRMRDGMRGMLESSVLTDANRFTLHLEALYRKMWKIWCNSV
jgi:protein O-GlcNAc transferase